jgi:hypothetical protein
MLKLVVLAAIATAFLAPSAGGMVFEFKDAKLEFKDANGISTLRGTVAATENAKGVVTSVKLDNVFLQCVLDVNGVVLKDANGVVLKDANGVVGDKWEITVGKVKPYKVVLDSTGKQLGKEMNGKEVEVKGVVTGDILGGGQTWIKVNSFKADPNVVTLKGTVAVTRDAKGIVTSVKLDKVTYLQCVLKDANGIDKTVEVTVDKKMTYQVVLDAAGKKLGKKMNGKEAKVIGVVSTEGEQKWIRVHSFKAVTKK